jgi:polysaccharide biosynthesis/export protein
MPFARTVFTRVACVLAALPLFGCEPGSGLPPLPEYHVQAYRLGGGDQVRIITFGEDQLTGQFRINDQGDIALPLLGGVHAAGYTTTQFGDRIARELRDHQLLKDPSVSVEVQAYRPVFVLGEVAKPGEYPFQPGMTVLTAVAIAGGFTYRAVQGYASVTRTTEQQGKAQEGKASPQDFVAPGDVIKVFERRF